MEWKTTCFVLLLALVLLTGGVSGDRRNNNNNRRGGQSGRGGGGRGGGSHGGHSRGEGGIDGFLAGVNASGICDAYLNTSVEDRESCTDDFLGEVAPGRAQYRLRRVNSFICLAGGVEADDACEILDVACNSDEASTLESCPRSSESGRERRAAGGNRGGERGRGNGRGSTGNHSQEQDAQRGIHGFLTQVNASGVCDAYLDTSVEDRESCTDDFLSEIVPGNSRRQFRQVVRRICLAGGIEAEDICEILDVSCNSDESSTLEVCPHSNEEGRQKRSFPFGNRFGGRDHHGQRGINGFVTRVNASGVCDAYLNSSTEEMDSCTDEFLGEISPGRAQYRLRRVNNFICLAGGVEADNACEVLDVACNIDEASTLESCPRPEGGRGRHRRSSSSSSEESSSEEMDMEEEDMPTMGMVTSSVP